MQSLYGLDVDSEAGNCRNGCGCQSSAVSGGGYGGCGSSSCSLDAEKLQQRRISSGSSECFVEVDLEAPSKEEAKSHSKKDCRICHLSIDLESQESGVIFELGCSCKNDLAAAHKHCAEAWFKIKGNRTCEICGSIASNVAYTNVMEPIELWSESDIAVRAAIARAAAATRVEAPRRFWQGHRFLNFLLACMVFAFVISWLFHFNVPS
ncbi:unnamed protein product [Cuscuta europaea]|uniref:RING-CH-type domain-containing protein n=1 Tax=Cuscuta europaea TaxID=41803 RepID=A0A9P0ZUT1_CUSEU|nr:unnamed protein product [Cuscuta europaea]